MKKYLASFQIYENFLSFHFFFNFDYKIQHYEYINESNEY